MGLGVAAAAVASAALFAAPAQAATVATARVVGDTVQFAAAKAQTNSVAITRSGRVVTVDDKVAIKAGKGCKAVRGDRTKVRCTTATAPQFVLVELGDKNDAVSNKTSIHLDAEGGAGNDTLIGGTSGDSLNGGAGNDRLVGGKGNDSLIGEAGNDLLEAGIGNDNLDPGLGRDLLKGGAGTDLVYYGSRSKPIVADLNGSTGNDGQQGEQDTIAADNEVLVGGARNDVLIGNATANRIFGGGGNDTVRGGDGNDTLVGQSGDDQVFGDNGDDYLLGENLMEGEPNPDNPSPGSPTAKDRLDGGANSADWGDNCIVLAAGTTVNCEQFGD